jgi:serine protease
VAVVDTGYLPHQDLAGAFAPGYDFIGDVQVANDGDGRDANASDPGDWITSTESRSGYFRGCTASNSSWHGTHVSGTIGARTNNGKGIAGINPAGTILPVRVLGKCGGYTSDITDGVRWAAGLPVTGVPANPSVAKVVNLSLGGSGACPSAWQSAIDAATAAGTVVVVAAGNSNADAANYSPASCKGVVTVASTGKAGNRAYYSNYGSTVEIAAPGGDKNADAGATILSTLNSGTTTPGADAYVKYQGTSMATPHVAGVVSLMLATNPSLTPAQVTQILQQSATPFPSGSTCASGCGAGIVNAAAAVAQAASPPPPPTTVAGTVPGAFAKLSPSDGRTGIKGSVTLSWAASTAATEYWVCLELTASPDGACTTFAYGPYTGTSTKFVGLASGATYEWEVEARNAAGATEASGPAWRFATR